MDLVRLTRAFHAIGKISPCVTATQIDILLEIALHPGLGTLEYARRTGVSAPVVSHIIARLSSRGRLRTNGDDTPGLGLIEQRPAPRDSRKKEVYLTDKGYALMKEIASILIKPEDNS